MAKVVNEVSQLKNNIWETPTPIGTSAEHVYLVTNTGQEISLADFFGVFKESAIGCGANLDTITSVVAKAYVDQQINALSSRIQALENAAP